MPAARRAAITSPANRSGPLRRRRRSKIPTSPPGHRVGPHRPPVALDRRGYLEPTRTVPTVFPMQWLSGSGARVVGLRDRSEEHTSELQSQSNLVCRLLLEKKKDNSSLASFASNPIQVSLLRVL